MNHKRTLFSFFFIFSLLFIGTNLAQEIKIRVTAIRGGDVRLDPNPSSALIAIASAGLTVTPIEKTGEWYFVELPPNKEGDVIAGYIHQSQVEEIYTEQRQEETKEEKKYDLLWKFQIGHPYKIHSTSATQSVTTTRTQGNQEKEKETEKQEITFLLTPKKKLENGHYEIILDYIFLKKENVSKDITIYLEGEESEDKQPKINVEVTGGSPELRSEEYKDILRKIVSNILEATVEMEVSSTGHVISMDMKKSPYDNLPAHTEFGKMVVDMIKDTITKEDLTSSIKAEMFIQLPSEPVAVNEHWPVKREFHMTGIHMDGTGQAVLQEVQNIDGKQTAVILEETSYKINTGGFNQNIEDMMKTVGRQSGISIYADSNIEAFENPVFNSKTEFNIQKGISSQTNWDDQMLKIGGTLKLTARGNTSEVEMDTVITVNSKVTWK